MKFFSIARNILFLLTAVLVFGCSPKVEHQKYITLGALLPLTGKDADEGLRAYNGLLLAREEINKNGGILGKKLDIIVLDDRGDTEFVVQQYKNLKEQNVAAIIGSSYSDVTMALAKAAEKDGIPIISPTASDPDITVGRRNVFRAIFIDDYQSDVMACFAYNSLKAKSALVLINRNLPNYGRIAQMFTESFKARGGTTETEFFSGDGDFSAILKKYAAKQPDVIFCPENFIPAAKLINTAHENGIKSYLLGSDAWDGLLAYINNPDAMKNVYYSTPFSFNDEDADVVKFVANYYGNYLQLPVSSPAAAYACVYILSEAIKITGNTSKDAIISAVKANELDQIIGRIKFDQNNNPRTNVFIIQIDGGVYSTFEKLCL